MLHFTLDPYLIVLSAKQDSIKYHFLSLWYDLTWDWTPVSRTIVEHFNHYGNGALLSIHSWRENSWIQTFPRGIALCEMLTFLFRIWNGVAVPTPKDNNHYTFCGEGLTLRLVIQLAYFKPHWWGVFLSLLFLAKVWIHLFSIRLWVNIRECSRLGNQFRRGKNSVYKTCLLGLQLHSINKTKKYFLLKNEVAHSCKGYL